jgi:hypothetical protein
LKEYITTLYYIILLLNTDFVFDSNKMRFEVLMAMKMSMVVFWVITQCGLVGRQLKLEAE